MQIFFSVILVDCATNSLTDFDLKFFSFFFPTVFFRLENLESLVASQQSDITAKDDKIDGLQKRYCIIVTMPEASYIASNYQLLEIFRF